MTDPAIQDLKGHLMIRQVSVAAILLSCGVFSAQAQEISVNKGKWTTETSFVGTAQMGDTVMPVPTEDISENMCIATEQDSKFSAEMLGLEGCTTSNVAGTSNKISFDLACTQDGIDMTGDMSMSVASDKNSMTGVINLMSTVAGMEISMAGAITGKRVGDC